MKEPPFKMRANKNSKLQFKKQQSQQQQQQEEQQSSSPQLKQTAYSYLLVSLLVLTLLHAAVPANADTAQNYNYGASFISNPSIYSYTVANQPLSGKIAVQQQQQQQSASNNNNNNYIKFAATAQQQQQQEEEQEQQHQQSIYRGNLNRNYYYTNIAAEASISTLPPLPDGVDAALASTVLTPIVQQQQQQQQQQLPTQPAPQTGCTLDRLAVYKVVLHTYWTRDLFPKHYPDWRPTAQWTKTLGRTHNANYALYHIGQQATSGVKQFTETGKTEVLDSIAGEQQQQQMQQQKNIKSTSASAAGAAAAAAATTTTATAAAPGAAAGFGNSSGSGGGGSGSGGSTTLASSEQRSVFDEFTMPAIQMGAGRSEAKLFVDSNHSLVSLMTRIVPSPDWFIGVDSFELCVGGSWIDTVTVEVDPLDAGTDNGFTFTAPNWPTSPQGVIYRITSRYPAHPAGSFYYPKSKRLPPIATFQFIKLKEYELSEVFNFAEDDRKYETVKTQTHLETEHNHVEMNNELSASIERERQNEFGTAQAAQMETERDRIRSKLLAKMNPIYSSSNNSANIIPKNDKHAIMQSIANSYRRTDRNDGGSSYASNRRRMAAKRRRDCRVSHWSEWTACSKTCGIGEMHRYRKVIKHGKRGGRPCPALQESKWCGTEKGCQTAESYFNWSDT